MLLFAVLGLLMLTGLTVLQIALAAGAPLGRFAWGGQYTVLPSRLRFGAVIAVLIYAVFAVFLLSGAGVVDLVADPVLSVGLWVITVYTALSAVLNAISRSKSERAVMAPVSLLLAASFLGVALSA